MLPPHNVSAPPQFHSAILNKNIAKLRTANQFRFKQIEIFPRISWSKIESLEALKFIISLIQFQFGIGCKACPEFGGSLF